jgi:hypothetical protein
MHRRLQFDMRENPASGGRHGSRLAVDTNLNSNAIGIEKEEAPLNTAPAEKSHDTSGTFAFGTPTLTATLVEDVNSTPFLTVRELATRLQVNPAWIYAHADYLGAYHLGKHLRFSWRRVLQRLEQ